MSSPQELPEIAKRIEASPLEETIRGYLQSIQPKTFLQPLGKDILQQLDVVEISDNRKLRKAHIPTRQLPHLGPLELGTSDTYAYFEENGILAFTQTEYSRPELPIAHTRYAFNYKLQLVEKENSIIKNGTLFFLDKTNYTTGDGVATYMYGETVVKGDDLPHKARQISRGIRPLNVGSLAERERYIDQLWGKTHLTAADIRSVHPVATIIPLDETHSMIIDTVTETQVVGSVYTVSPDGLYSAENGESLHFVYLATQNPTPHDANASYISNHMIYKDGMVVGIHKYVLDATTTATEPFLVTTKIAYGDPIQIQAGDGKSHTITPWTMRNISSNPNFNGTVSVSKTLLETPPNMWRVRGNATSTHTYLPPLFEEIALPVTFPEGFVSVPPPEIE